MKNSLNHEEKRMLPPALLSAEGVFDCGLIIFDLDGTLIDSGPGIKNSIRRVIDTLGLEGKTEAELDSCIGPPMRENFTRLFGMTQERGEEALRLHRKFYFSKGIYEAAVYDGIPQLLRELRQKGYTVAVGTSKAWVLAHRVLRHFGLRSYIDGVFGCYLDGRLDSKTEVLQAAAAHYAGIRPMSPGRLGTRPDPGTTEMADCTAGGSVDAAASAAAGWPVPGPRALMVGDRFYDIDGAKNLGLPAVGVTYGYGSPDELKKSGAVLIAAHPAEIGARLPDLKKVVI